MQVTIQLDLAGHAALPTDPEALRQAILEAVSAGDFLVPKEPVTRQPQSQACACTGPAGNCHCIRQARSESLEITEALIAPDLFALLSDEDKMLINNTKLKALSMHLQRL